MIHLNLIDAAERESLIDAVNPVRVTDVSAQVKSSKKKAATIAVAALLAFAAFSCFLSVCGVPEPLQGLFPEAYLSLIDAKDPSRSALTLGTAGVTTAGGSLEAQAAAAAAAAKHRESLSIQQVVGEINPQVLYNNKRTSYEAYLPLEKISYQRSAMAQFLTFLNTATPDDVGFSDCIFQAPNYYYVRGVAAKPVSQRSFLERIKTVSSDFRTPPIPENAPATDITAFGLFNVTNANLNAVDKFVPAAELAEEVKAVKALATASKVSLGGFEKPSVEDFGVYKRYTYQVNTNADFPELQAFVTALAGSPTHMGIQKADMKLSKKYMMTNMKMVVIVKP